MVQASEITDGEILGAWLHSWPEDMQRGVSLLVSYRATMRALPVFIAQLQKDKPRSGTSDALPVLRATLTAGAAAAGAGDEVRDAARGASKAAQTIMNKSIGVAKSAALASAAAAQMVGEHALLAATPASSANNAIFKLTNYSPDAKNTIWRVIRDDALMIEAGTLQIDRPLWLQTVDESGGEPSGGAWVSSAPPGWFNDTWKTASDWLASHPGYEFWIRWYEDALLGRNPTVDDKSYRRFLTDIALIPEADWERGAEHVARIIAEIEARYRPTEAAELAAALPMAETIEVNPATGLFHTVPIAMQNAPLIGSVLARVQDALEDALLGHNGISETSREFRVVTRVATRYANDPQQIEMEFTALAQGLRRQFDGEEVPRNEDTLALLAALEEGVRAIRATHPEVEANRRLLARQAIGELSDDERQFLADEATEALVALTDAPLGEDLTEAITEMLAPRLPAARRYDMGGKSPALPGEVRLFSRAAKIALSSQLGDVILKIDSSPGYKGARIATTIAALVTLGVKIFGVI